MYTELTVHVLVTFALGTETIKFYITGLWSRFSTSSNICAHFQRADSMLANISFCASRNQGDAVHIGLPDSQSRYTGDFWTQKRVPIAMNVVLVVVLVLLLGVIIVIRFSCP